MLNQENNPNPILHPLDSSDSSLSSDSSDDDDESSSNEFSETNARRNIDRLYTEMN